MKKAISIMFLACLFGCTPGGTKYDNMESVKKQFPNAIVKTVPGHGYSFFVKDIDGSSWYVETLNLFDTNITCKEQIF